MAAASGMALSKTGGGGNANVKISGNTSA